MLKVFNDNVRRCQVALFSPPLHFEHSPCSGGDRILFLGILYKYIYIYIYTYCKGRFWFLSSKNEWIKAQIAQYNEFVESRLKS